MAATTPENTCPRCGGLLNPLGPCPHCGWPEEKIEEWTEYVLWAKREARRKEV